MIKTNSNLEIDLADDATVEALKTADVIETMKADYNTPKTHTFSINFTEEQVQRLSRLSATGDWKEALNETIESLFLSRIGRSTISSPSQYSAKVTGPSSTARFV